MGQFGETKNLVQHRFLAQSPLKGSGVGQRCQLQSR